jgi:hypothetical protein
MNRRDKIDEQKAEVETRVTPLRTSVLAPGNAPAEIEMDL